MIHIIYHRRYVFILYILEYLYIFISKFTHYFFFCSCASSLMALPPFSISLPAPSMVLQPVNAPRLPSRKIAVNKGTRIFLIMMNLYRVRCNPKRCRNKCCGCNIALNQSGALCLKRLCANELFAGEECLDVRQKSLQSSGNDRRRLMAQFFPNSSIWKTQSGILRR